VNGIAARISAIALGSIAAVVTHSSLGLFVAGRLLIITAKLLKLQVELFGPCAAGLLPTALTSRDKRRFPC